ncbi:MAG: hypothetical protein K8H88_13520, partial [Sandaracinaceae bacterium]|nr:hypothetical protein [Sandaracinaceae bacterium]
MWRSHITVLGLGLGLLGTLPGTWMASHARADPPITTVYFGVEAGRPSPDPISQVTLRARPEGRLESITLALVGRD